MQYGSTPTSICRSNACVGILFLTALIAATYPALIYYAAFMSDPGLLHEEIRILFPYHRFVDSALFEGDYISDFLRHSAHSTAYDAITWVWAKLFGDITKFHLVILPLSLTLIYLIGIFLAARLIGGLAVAWMAIALSLLQTNILFQMASSLTHAFAFPLLAWTLYALQRRSVAGLFTLTILSAALYPVMTPVIGLSFAYYLLVTPRESGVTRETWPLRYRLGILVAAALCAILLVSASLPHSEGAYGNYFPPGTHTDVFPENGVEGRHFRGALEPVSYGFLAFAQQFSFLASEDFLKPGTRLRLVAALTALCLVLGLAFLATPARGGATECLKPFVFASVVTAIIFVPLVPSLGYRFIFYPLHVLFAMLFALMIDRVFRRMKVSDFVRFGGAFLVIAALSTTMNSRFPGAMMPFAVKLIPDQRAVIAFAAEQPVGAKFAGWPGDTIESIPYLAKRPALLLSKTHYPMYEDYALEMRQRMYATIDAYFALDSAALKRLHDQWAVRFFIVDRKKLEGAHSGDDGVPKTFRPFDQYRDDVLARHAGAKFYLESPPSDAVAYKSGQFYVLDLSVL